MICSANLFWKNGGGDIHGFKCRQITETYRRLGEAENASAISAYTAFACSSAVPAIPQTAPQEQLARG